MLNKLLKRCMPWMDKGRWYKISVTGNTPDSLHVDYDPIFSSVTFDLGALVITFADSRPYQLIDAKFVGQKGMSSPGPNISVDSYRENGLDILIPTPGTLWLFIDFG